MTTHPDQVRTGPETVNRSSSFGADLFRGRARLGDLGTDPAETAPLPRHEEEFLSGLRLFCESEADGQLIEREDSIPDSVIRGLADLGALAIRIPEEYGGLGMSAACYYRALAVVNGVHSALGELVAAHQSIGVPQPVLLFGTPEQKREFLPRCVRGISAFALTEPEVGNDPFRVRTTATPAPGAGTYTLNGVKSWVTNGVVADLLMVVAAVPESDAGPGGLTAFVVDADAPGVTVEHRSSFLGLRGLENGVIRLHGVRVGARNRVGGEGAGLEVALAAQDSGRLSLPAVCAGAAKWSLFIARRWAGVRRQGGRPIGEHDAVAGKLADMAAGTFALEAMVEIGGRRADLGFDTGVDAELAKLFASERAWQIVDDLMQIRGGRGYETAESAAARGERGVPVERLFRDLRVGRIFDGSTEALRSFIAQDVFARLGEEGALPPSAGEEGVERPGGVLGEHRRFVEDTAALLPSLITSLLPEWDGDEGPAVTGRSPGRVVDIGAELYAMSVTCAYAAARAGTEGAALELADAFCRRARRAVSDSLEELRDNDDAQDRKLASRVLAGSCPGLEDGVVDPSIQGPWIASTPAGAPEGPNLRRRVPLGGPERPGGRRKGVPAMAGAATVDVTALVADARRLIRARTDQDRFLPLLEEGRVPEASLRDLAGALYHLVSSDKRSFSALASRFPEGPAGELFATMAAGEQEALDLLLDFASVLELGEADLRDHEPAPESHAYPACLARAALTGGRADVPLALIVNHEASGRTYARVARALHARYGMPEDRLGHFRFFARTPPELIDQAAATVADGCSRGGSAEDAVRLAVLVHRCEAVFWNALVPAGERLTGRVGGN